MTSPIAIGAELQHDGMTIGTVERVEKDLRSGEPTSVLLRHGRADYLLRIPADMVISESGQLELDSSVNLDEVEQVAVDSGKTPPEGRHFEDGGPTQAAPSPTEVLGHEPGMDPHIDGQSTG